MKTFVLLIVASVVAFGFCARVSAQAINGIQVVVHDSVITRLEVEELTTPLKPVLARQYGTKPEIYTAKVSEAMGDSMEKLVERQLILNDYRASGYHLPDSIIEEAIQEEIRAEYGDRANLTKTLHAQGMTYEKYRQRARDRMIVGLLRNKYIGQENIISPHKIETYFKEHQNDYKVEEQVRLRMIVLNKSSEADDGAKSIAEEIQVKLKDGAAFSEMASVYSQGSQRNQGGDWGWVERSTLRKELADAAFALKAGETSSIVETPEAIYLMFIEERRDAHVKPLNEVRDEIEKILLQQQQASAQKRYIDRLKKKTFVRYF